MPPPSLPAIPSGKPTAWEEAIYAFLVEKRSRSGSTRTVESYARMDLLAGLLECVCGRRIRSDGTYADGRHRKLHPGSCEVWGTSARLGDETWEAPVLA